MSEMWTHTKTALTALESKLKCFICGQLPEDPHMLWCKHTFCKRCVLKLKSCPKCSFAVVPHEIVPDIAMKKMLHFMKVASDVTNGVKIEDIEVNNEEPETLKKENTLARMSTRNVKPSKKTIPEQSCEDGLSKSRTEIKTPKRSVKMSVSPDKFQTPNANSVQRKLSSTSLNEMKKDIYKRGTPTRKTLFTNTNVKTCVLFSAKKSQNPNKVNKKGETPLQLACRQGKLDIVQKLLRDGAEANVKDYANWTPLCDAVGRGSLEVVRILLEAGAAVNTPAYLNTTALVEAVMRKDKRMIQLLLKYGADMHQRTSLNNTALSIADDELKAVMMAEDKKSISPHPRVTTVPRAMLATNLLEHQIDQVMSLCKKFNLSLCNTFMDDVTHIVVEMTDQNTCHGSVDVMLGILSGCSVVSLEWVSACLKAGSLLPVDTYEPNGTNDLPNTNVFHRARLNRESLLPRLFDGCHISLQQGQMWSTSHKHDIVRLIQAAGAQYQARTCDAERIPPAEQTVMFHTTPTSPLGMVSHIILYQPGPAEPMLKYNMEHVKSFSVTWFLHCVKTFSISQTPT